MRHGPLYRESKPVRELALSPRERQCLIAAMLGVTVEETARWACLSPDTVARHRTHYLAKLGARNTTHAAVLALSRGIISLTDLNLDDPDLPGALTTTDRGEATRRKD